MPTGMKGHNDRAGVLDRVEGQYQTIKVCVLGKATAVAWQKLSRLLESGNKVDKCTLPAAACNLRAGKLQVPVCNPQAGVVVAKVE